MKKMKSIDPVAASLAHTSRALDATSEEEAEQHLGMATFYANVAHKVAMHASGDHSQCAHRILGVS